jgi:hypothetical protein
MKSQGLLLAIFFLALVGGSFATGFAFMQAQPGPAPDDKTAPLPQSGPGLPSPGSNVAKIDHETAPGRQGDPAATPKQLQPALLKAQPPKQLTRAEVAEHGDLYLGRRVAWVAQRILSQSTLIGGKEGTQHILKGQDPRGEFSFDLPIIAEEPNPLKLNFHSRTKEEMQRDLNEFLKFKKESGLKGRQAAEQYSKRLADIVTVTGTIARTDTLILLGEGTRYDVPVLTDIVITSNRKPKR